MEHTDRVSIFIEVVKQQSFSAAARSLGMSAPAVSKQVQSLEDKLQVRLLTRTTRHVALTEEGALYFERARKAMADLVEAERQIQELKACPTGHLKMNVPRSFGTQYLTDTIANFAHQYPEVELEVDFDDRWVDIVKEGYDVVVRIGHLADSSLIARKLAPCPILLCAAPTLIEQHDPLVQPEQLKDWPAVVYNQHGQAEDWRFQPVKKSKVLSEGSVRLQRRFASNTAEMQYTACIQGLGVGLLPIFTAMPALERGELVQLLPNFQTIPERNIFAIFPRKSHLSTRVRLFVDALSDCARQLPWIKPLTTT